MQQLTNSSSSPSELFELARLMSAIESAAMTDSQPWPAELRLLRSRRPQRAAKGERGQTFTASLAQAEQLWLAGASVPPDSRPLLWYYGLAQAGRALCAGANIRRWQPPAAHGLRFVLADSIGSGSQGLIEAEVEPRGDGLVQTVASILNSPVLSSRERLTRIVSSAGLIPFVDSGNDPAPLEIETNWMGSTALQPAAVKIAVGPMPVALCGRYEERQSNGATYKYAIAPSRAELVEWLSPYLKLRELAKNVLVTAPIPDLSEEKWPGREWSRWYAQLSTPVEMPLAEHFEWARALFDVDETRGIGQPHGRCLPNIGANDRAQHPLIAWWLILYCYSMLARYYPSRWRAALDIDKSEAAIAIEHSFEVAAHEVPHLLVEAFGSLA